MQVWRLVNKFVVDENFKEDVFQTHAQLPTPLVLSEKLIRVFFASRDARQYSSIFSIDIEYDKRTKSFSWEKFGCQPVLLPGRIGSFDEHGVYPSFVLQHEEKFYLYYIGWNRGITEPLFYASIGLAVSEDGANFSKISDGPVLGRNQDEPFLVTSPFVERQIDSYKMYFVSGNEWLNIDGKIESRYDVKSIESKEISRWESTDRKTVIPLGPNETNVARPWISTVNKDRLLYFCFLRKGTNGYQIGVAKEEEPDKWLRLENELSFEGLSTNENMAYPAIVEMQGHRFMFLNGNNYGKNGFYIFRLEIDKVHE
jgi:hypothetical protein